jgi:exodeoxyribonuclease V alpha subunit
MTLPLGADPYTRNVALAMRGLLADFNRAEVLGAADVHVARQLGQLGGERDETVLLAAALTVRAVRNGSVCLDLATIRDAIVGDDTAVDDVTDAELAGQLAAVRALDWPDPVSWASAVQRSPLVQVIDAAAGTGTGTGTGDGAVEPPQIGGPGRPLRWSDGLLYLDRYWRQERLVATELDARGGVGLADGSDVDRLQRAIARMFPGKAEARQRIAAAVCAGHRLAVIAGGPGTGKTTAVARMLAVLVDHDGARPRIALAAPTGKAAARLQQAVRDEVATFEPADRERLGELSASTLHRLLGWKPRSKSRFRHDRTNHLPYDIVVVDETSMVSLTMMARLMEAIRPQARLVLVGDPDQLASVEAGAVLGDIVGRATDIGATAGAAQPERAGGLQVIERLCPVEVAGLDAPSRVEAAAGVTRLTHRFRFGGAIAELADAVRTGDADAAIAVLRASQDPSAPVLLVPWEVDALRAERAPFREQVVASARTLAGAALAGDVPGALIAMDRHRLLCAHRRGPYGASLWAAMAQRWIAADQLAHPLSGSESGELPVAGANPWWAPGRPLLTSEND